MTTTVSPTVETTRTPTGGDGQAFRWRMGLVAHYLFSSGRRRGLMLRWSDGLTAKMLTDAVEQAKDPPPAGQGPPPAKDEVP